jgi:hypothetical protein
MKCALIASIPAATILAIQALISDVVMENGSQTVDSDSRIATMIRTLGPYVRRHNFKISALKFAS